MRTSISTAAATPPARLTASRRISGWRMNGMKTRSRHGRFGCLIAPPPAAGAPSGKPAIAVLPFDNLSGDPAQQFLADAIAEDLVTNLSHDRWFDVIAHTSTQKYRGDKAGIADIAAELGARYIVDGSLRKAGDLVRISVVLIDASDGRQIWDQRCDRVADDLFQLQDEITMCIAGAVIPEVNVAEQRSAMRRMVRALICSAGASSITFWCRRCIEQSRSPR